MRFPPLRIHAHGHKALIKRLDSDRSDANEQQLVALISASNKGSQAWLNGAPTQSGLIFSDREFRITVRKQLGVPLFDHLPFGHCICTKKPSGCHGRVPVSVDKRGHHLVTCRMSKLKHDMHKELKNWFIRLLKATGKRVEQTEPRYKVSAETGIQHRSDIKVNDWEDGKPLVIDVTHASTQAATNKKLILHRVNSGSSTFELGHFVKVNQEKKETEQQDMCSDSGWLGRGGAFDSAGSASTLARTSQQR